MAYRHIKDLREDNDIKQIQMAKLLGIAQNTYSQYETGVLDFSAKMLIQLADFYGTSVDYLLDRTNNPKPPLKK